MPQPGTRAHVLMIAAVVFAGTAILSAVALYGIRWALQPLSQTLPWLIASRTALALVALSWPFTPVLLPIAAGAAAVAWTMKG